MTGRRRPAGPRFRRGLVVGLAVAAFSIAGFALAGAFDVGVLVDPRPAMGAGWAAAAVGVWLLVADVVAPVPSSLVMLAHGALFGAGPGAVLSLAGRTGNAVVAVLLGRRAARALDGGEPEPPAEAELGRSEALLRRWGLPAIVLTRPVPVLAESTTVAAGAMGMSAAPVVVAAAVGAVPEAVLYAMAGAVAASFANAAAVFVAALALAAGAWLVLAGRERHGGGGVGRPRQGGERSW